MLSTDLPDDIPLLKVEDLSKSYGDQSAVKALSFGVAKNEIVGLLGPNGAGKTTTIESILGLRAFDSGCISLNGRDLSKHRRYGKSNIGAQLQASVLPAEMTALEGIRLMGAFYKNPIKESNLVEQFDLIEIANRRFGTLSVGQQLRVKLALAFVNNPKLLLLDEPTAGLDPNLRSKLLQLIRASKQEGRGILFATHYLQEAQDVCDRVIILNQGQIVLSGDPHHLIRESNLPSKIVCEIEGREIGKIPDSIGSLSDGEKLRYDAVDRRLFIESQHPQKMIPELLKDFDRKGIEIRTLEIQNPSLEDVFLTVTQSNIEESAEGRGSESKSERIATNA